MPSRIALRHGQKKNRALEAKPPAVGPSILIGARGIHGVKHGYDASTDPMTVRIGAITWIVTDALDFGSMRDAYTRLDKLARIILPDSRTPKLPPR